MPSSTSNFDPVASGTAPASSFRGPIVWALLAIAVMLVGFEVWTRFAFSRVSRVESRTMQDHKAALLVRHGTDSKPTILLLGNSLLLEALDYDRLREDLKDRAVPTRFTVEQTTWLDWYYGLRRLFAEGVRPDRVVLCLNIQQLTTYRLRGDYAAYYLIQTGDLSRAGVDAGYNLTKISSLYVARYSLAFAGLNSLRNFVLNKIAPGYGAALHDLRFAPATDEPKNTLLPEITKALASLQSVCGEYRTRCDFLEPPGTAPHGEVTEAELIEAGKRTGTRILIPVRVNQWGPEMYRDGFHATAAAALPFTDLLAKTLVGE